jgi:hypothetical protein
VAETHHDRNDFGLAGEDDEVLQEPSTDKHVVEGDKLETPKFVADNRFQPPKDFGPSYLKVNVNRPGFVKFATNAWEKLTNSAINLLNILKGMFMVDQSITRCHPHSINVGCCGGSVGKG